MVLLVETAAGRAHGLVGSSRVGIGSRRISRGISPSHREADEHHGDALARKGRNEEVLPRMPKWYFKFGSLSSKPLNKFS